MRFGALGVALAAGTMHVCMRHDPVGQHAFGVPVGLAARRCEALDHDRLVVQSFADAGVRSSVRRGVTQHAKLERKWKADGRLVACLSQRRAISAVYLPVYAWRFGTATKCMAVNGTVGVVGGGGCGSLRGRQLQSR